MPDEPQKLTLAFALEYSLGHVTHAENLKKALAANNAIVTRYLDIPYDNTPLPEFAQPFRRFLGNWSLRASLVASSGMNKWVADSDAAFFHTQVTSLLSASFMKRVPSIVSIDATPLQYDQLGAFYAHETGSPLVESLKKQLNQRAFRAARHMVAWSEWAKASLVGDYGIPASKVTVIPPGIDTDRWSFDRSERAPGGVRLLFVGGDFPRKGGDTLLAAFARARQFCPDLTLHIATKTDAVADGIDGIVVHRGLQPNSGELVQLYRDADLFVFPTRGDCLPLAIMEALASGLPVITTRVGAIPEAVVDGVTGKIVDIDSPSALSDAIVALANDGESLAAMSIAARSAALDRFSAAKNYAKLVDLLCSLATGKV
ncbi:MAG TPA: glycosyltransferase family 4 protein [Capsulimonadaceae bacterium]|jgi:glycosyltransferase involved in cell wall biosynthesis